LSRRSALPSFIRRGNAGCFYRLQYLRKVDAARLGKGNQCLRRP
jgi:hypothetical protein